MPHVCLPFLVDDDYALLSFRVRKRAPVCLVELFEQLVFDDIRFEAGNVLLATSRQSAVQSPSRWPDDLDRVDSHQRFEWYVNNECSVVSDAVSKWHYTRIADVEITCYPKAVDGFGAAEERCTWMCAGVLHYCLPHVESCLV